MLSDKLALAGGLPTIDRTTILPPWPQTTPEDEQSVLEALRNRDLTSLSFGGSVERLEIAWALWLECAHCVAVSNGTAALKLALAAMDIGEGDEVIVPALSFIASAFAPLHVGAQPVFADIDPVTFNMDPGQVEERITDRTRALMVVHLHGLAADMDRLLCIARRYDLRVIEDAAQAHGAAYKGRKVGAIGDVGVFSLNVSKNLPTCGEGGLITTNDSGVAERIRMLRQFGEPLKRGNTRLYQHEDIGWNDKLGGVQAAYTLSRLRRFQEENARRAENVAQFLKRLKGLPGLVIPSAPADCEHVWHILRFRANSEAAGLGGVASSVFQIAVQRALRAEGVPVGPYQRMPLPAQPVFSATARTGMSRLGQKITPTPFNPEDFPICCDVIGDSFTLQRVHLNPGAGQLLSAYADAFEKVFSRHLDHVRRIAGAAKYTPPWV